MNIKIIAGLGNPGRAYAHTPHNAGFLALDYLAKKFSARPWRAFPQKGFAYTKVKHLALIKPLTFMNESGATIARAVKYFKGNVHELLLIHDESDLPLGAHKFSFDRGAAGHKGVQSAIQALKTKRFLRLRIGTRTKQGIPAGSFALKSMNARDLEVLYGVFGGTIEKLIEKESP